MKQTRCLL